MVIADDGNGTIIMSEVEAFWTKCKEAAEARLKMAEDNIRFEEALIEMCEEKRKEKDNGCFQSGDNLDQNPDF